MDTALAVTGMFLGVPLLVVFALSFLLGSIPWGVIVSRLFFHTDIREHGSGNIGTTNAMRSLGKVGGGAVFLLDFGKGLASGFIAAFALAAIMVSTDSDEVSAGTSALFTCVAFLGCVWGHVFSPWLKFKGGKGIAVAVGCLFVTFGWEGALIEIAVFAVVVFCTRYVSAGSIAAAVACPCLAWYYFLFETQAPAAWACCLLAAVTVIWAHRGNIGRLRRGTERRIGAKKQEA